MEFRQFLSLLDGVRGTDSQYTARCPAHDDKRASLCVSQGSDGRILLKCQAGCDWREVIAALGVKKADLFPQKGPKITGTVRPALVATYAYQDENGQTLGEKLRYSDKHFTWRRPRGNGWEYKKPAGIVPYRLPDLATNDTVFLVEGEKDADALAALGLSATCSPDGAGPGKWKAAYSKWFAGKTVYILQDNDAVGKAYAKEEAAAVSEVAKQVKVLDLCAIWAELPEHGDVSDLIAHMGGKAAAKAVLSLAECAPVWKPEAAKQEGPPHFFDGRVFLHNVMGDYLIQKYGVCKIGGAVHIYENGIYKPGEETLHGHMLKLVPTLSDARRREVFKYVKVSLDTPVREVAPPRFIPFLSRVYDLETNSFLEYSPDMVFLNRFPYDYNPDAPSCPLLLQTLSEIACNDPEVINLILEAFGNCFYLLNAFRGSVMLYGQSGSNGKSTLLNMLAQMVGRENASFLSLQDTAERFRLVEVYGKAVNIGDDIPNSYFPDSSRFKKLVTGETVIGERKGQDPIAFKPYAKMFFAMNDLPPVSDKSRAFFSRILLIPLNNDFSRAGMKDVSLKDRAWTREEMEFLTMLSMLGLKRLIKQGDFTRPACMVEALRRYEVDNNPVIGFLEEYGEVDGQPTVKVYWDFKRWCEDNGHRNIMTNNKFSREVCNIRSLTIKTMRHAFANHAPCKCFAGQ